MAPVRDFVSKVPKSELAAKATRGQGEGNEADEKGKQASETVAELRPLSMSDLMGAKDSVLPTGESAAAYQQQEQQRKTGQGSNNMHTNALPIQQMLQSFMAMAAAQQQPRGDSLD